MEPEGAKARRHPPKAWEWILLLCVYVPALLAFWAWILVLPWYGFPFAGLIGVCTFNVGFFRPNAFLYCSVSVYFLVCFVVLQMSYFAKRRSRIPAELLASARLATILSLGAIAAVGTLAGFWEELAYVQCLPNSFIPAVIPNVVNLSLVFVICWIAWLVALRRICRAGDCNVGRVSGFLIVAATAELVLAGIAMAQLPAIAFDLESGFVAYNWWGAYTGVVLGLYVLLCAGGVAVASRVRYRGARTGR